MPFTISHAAVVLPFSRVLARWRLLSAVVIGSMVPDFGLFFPWRMHRFETHSAFALLTFCLPVGLATYWLFQYLIKAPLIEVLPEGAYARWRPFSSAADFSSLRQWVMAACGVLVGAVTHLVWDAFTHENARGIRMVPWLEEPAVEIGNHRMAGVRLLQDGSSLLGLVVVLVLVCYALRRGHEQLVPDRAFRPAERWTWVLTYGIAAMALSAAWLLLAGMGEPRTHSVKLLVTGIAVASLRGIATALLCVSVAEAWRLRAIRARRLRQ
jgi:formate-dependent nitrite reductase membrane component NrfD